MCRTDAQEGTMDVVGKGPVVNPDRLAEILAHESRQGRGSLPHGMTDLERWLRGGCRCERRSDGYQHPGPMGCPDHLEPWTT